MTRAIEMAATVVLLWTYGMSCRRLAQQERQLAGDMTIGPEWAEITPQPRLEARYRLNDVLIEVPSLAYPEASPCADRRQIPIAGGRCVDFAVELVSDSGSQLRLTHNLALFNRFRYLRATDETIFTSTERRTFAALRLRAGEPVHIARIVWMSYEQQQGELGAGFPSAATR